MYPRLRGQCIQEEPSRCVLCRGLYLIQLENQRHLDRIKRRKVELGGLEAVGGDLGLIPQPIAGHPGN